MDMAENEITNFFADLKLVTAAQSDDREILKKIVPVVKSMAKNAG